MAATVISPSLMGGGLSVMLDLMAEGRAIAARLVAASENPQVIRNQSASPSPVAAVVPAIPQDPQHLESESEQPRLMANPLDGLELLPQDHRWLRSLLQALPITRQRDLLTEYRQRWLKAYEAEAIDHKKANKGRFAANTWIGNHIRSH